MLEVPCQRKPNPCTLNVEQAGGWEVKNVNE